MLYMQHNKNRRRMPVMRRRRKSSGMRFNLSSSSLLGLLVMVFCLLVFMWPNPAPKNQTHLRKALLLEETNHKTHLKPTTSSPAPQAKVNVASKSKKALKHGKLENVNTKDLISQARKFSEKLTTGEEILNAMLMMEMENQKNTVVSNKNFQDRKSEENQNIQSASNDGQTVEEKSNVDDEHSVKLRDVVSAPDALSESKKAKAFEAISKVLLERYQELQEGKASGKNDKGDDKLMTLLSQEIALPSKDVKNIHEVNQFQKNARLDEEAEKKKEQQRLQVDDGPDPSEALYSLMDQIASM